MGHDVAIRFEDVSKKFWRGERHDSLRDLIPALFKRARRPASELREHQFWALRNVSFEVRRGTALGIIGPNGAGKSTALKVLTRILRPTTGRSEVKGRVGALIEIAAGFHQDLTGRENIFLQGAILGMKRAEIARKLDAIIDFAGVAQFVDTPVKRYSSGMNARLGFSIAAHLDPDVLIIDEVLSVGDMAFQERCLARMGQFLRDGVAVVFVSHNLQAVSSLCTSAAYLSTTVRAIGATSDVIKSYLGDIGSRDAPTSGGAIDIEQCELTDVHGQPASRVAPGTRLTLRVRYQPHTPMGDLTFGFVVRRSTDGLIVYMGDVTDRELDVCLDRANALTVDFDFAVNLTRGHYHVETHLFHNPTQTFVAKVAPAASFVVEEMRTYQGIADLALQARIVSCSRAVEEASAAFS